MNDGDSTVSIYLNCTSGSLIQCDFCRNIFDGDAWDVNILINGKCAVCRRGVQ